MADGKEAVRSWLMIYGTGCEKRLILRSVQEGIILVVIYAMSPSLSTVTLSSQ